MGLVFAVVEKVTSPSVSNPSVNMLTKFCAAAIIVGQALLPVGAGPIEPERSRTSTRFKFLREDWATAEIVMEFLPSSRMKYNGTTAEADTLTCWVAVCVGWTVTVGVPPTTVVPSHPLG